MKSPLGEKGRDTLQGLCKTTGLVGFDWVMESPVPPVLVTADGVLRFDYDEKLAGDGLEWSRRFPNGKGVRCRVTEEERHQRTKTACPWVRISYCPQWIKDEIANRWTRRKVAVRGRRETSPWATHDVFPFDVVVAWFRFLWPEEKEWLARAVKYLTGFSEGWVQQRPGVGAILKDVSVFPMDYPNSYQVVRITDQGIPVIKHEVKESVFSICGTKWEVIG